MIMNDVCVLGGSGFVGRHVCHQLVARGYSVRVPTRDRERAKGLILLPTADVVTADVHDPQALNSVVRGCDAVVNLVGVLHDGRARASLHSAHVELAHKVIEACRQSGVRRLLHMSALNADVKGPSEYLRSKGQAEAVVRESGLDFTIFRPSVIFGRGDHFLTLFATLQRILPAIVLGSPDARFQPIHVEDVARAFVESLPRLESFGASYDLAGARVYTLRELVDYVGQVTGHRKHIIGLGKRLSYWQAAVMGLMPVKLITRDNYLSMTVDSVSASPLPFGITPTPLEAVAPMWLGQRTPRNRYNLFRDRTRARP